MNVNTSGAASDIKVRLIDWHIRGTREDAPNFKGSTERPKDLPQPPAVAPEKAGLAMALGVGLAVTLAAAAIIWLFVRPAKDSARVPGGRDESESGISMASRSLRKGPGAAPITRPLTGKTRLTTAFCSIVASPPFK